MKQTTSTTKIVMAAGFIVYLYILIKLILFKGGAVDIHFLLHQLEFTLHHPTIIFGRGGNYIPFKEILKEINSMPTGNSYLSSNLVGNFLAFIPLGIFIPQISKKRGSSFVSVFILSLSLSLCFEVTQLLLLIGIFDVDDLILNTSGGIFGYVVWRLFMLINSTHTARNRQALI
ncbi:MAG: VanZ family protein [Gorillibacterium sp.]|nr:VanZ family protein [Gorillibacterium sp.]